MELSIIAAISDNYAIGMNNQLLWRIADDMKFFKTVTKGHHVLMGRRTYESFPKQFRPLPDRTNIVITTNKHFVAEGCYVFDSIEKGLAFAYKNGEKELMIIGGGEIYRETIDYAHNLYLTIVHKTFENADTFFPKVEVIDPFHYLNIDDAPHLLALYGSGEGLGNIKNNLLNPRVSFVIRRSYSILNKNFHGFAPRQLKKPIQELNGNFMAKMFKNLNRKASFKNCKWLIMPFRSGKANKVNDFDFDILELKRLPIKEKKVVDLSVSNKIKSEYSHIAFDFLEDSTFGRPYI